MIWRIFKWLAIAVGSLLLLLVAALAVVWERPQLLLNEARVRQALGHMKSVEASWSSFRWDFTNQGLWAKTTDLEIHDLCVHVKPTISACAPELRMELSFSVRGFRPAITRLGTLRAEVSQVTYRPAPEAPRPTKKKDPLPDLRPPNFAALFPKEIELGKLGDFWLHVREFRLISPGNPDLVANASLEKIASAPGAATLRLQAELVQGDDLALTLRGQGAILPGGEKLVLGGELAGELSGWKVRAPLNLTWSHEVKLHAEPVARHGRDRFTTPLDLSLTGKRLALEWGKLEFHRLFPKKLISLDQCHLESRLNQKAGYPERSELRCGLSFVSLGQGAILPPLRMKVGAELSLRPVNAQVVSADLHFLEEGENSYLASRAEFAAKAQVRPGSGEWEGKPDLALTADLRAPSLATWKNALDRTALAVPAPFRALDGPITLSLRLDHATEEELLLRAELKSDLHGASQAFVTNSEALLRLAHPFHGAKAIHVDARAELTDVALVAPPLRLESPPRPLPDKRFFATRVPTPPRQVATVPVTYRIAIVTKNPVRIRTNLLEDPVPLALNLTLADHEGMGGTLEVLPVPVAVFKKKADVKSVKLTFRPGSDVAELNGLLVTTNPDITVRILLLGSTDKPRVEFESDPPLSRQQIVSVLLFNKSVDELNDEEASSAGSFSQATADGALGLFSLLFLSSTPIESISYDPVSQTYAARLRVDQKTTLSVGSDFDRERQVALRRRLGGRWAIRTELQDNEGRPDVLLTLLEWFKRF